MDLDEVVREVAERNGRGVILNLLKVAHCPAARRKLA
jgi:hypothetical protein